MSNGESKPVCPPKARSRASVLVTIKGVEHHFWRDEAEDALARLEKALGRAEERQIDERWLAGEFDDIRAAEREECAKIAEETRDACRGPGDVRGPFGDYPETIIANRIRQRSGDPSVNELFRDYIPFSKRPRSIALEKVAEAARVACKGLSQHDLHGVLPVDGAALRTLARTLAELDEVKP